MSLPNIPTDNLYKFMAIAGLVLFISANTLYVIDNNKIADTAQEWLRNGSIYTFEQKTLNTEINSSQKRIKELENTMRTAKPQEKQTISAEISSEKDLVKNNNNKLKEVNKNIISLNNSLNIDRFKKEAEEAKLTTLIVDVVGLLSIFFGFSLWYNRLQKYQDIMIKQKAESKSNSGELADN